MNKPTFTLIVIIAIKNSIGFTRSNDAPKFGYYGQHKNEVNADF